MTGKQFISRVTTTAMSFARALVGRLTRNPELCPLLGVVGLGVTGGIGMAGLKLWEVASIPTDTPRQDASYTRLRARPRGWRLG